MKNISQILDDYFYYFQNIKKCRGLSCKIPRHFKMWFDYSRNIKSCLAIPLARRGGTAFPTC